MSSVNVIIWLILSLWGWPKVITLRGLHCSIIIVFVWSQYDGGNIEQTTIG